jgi:hypothetical protein
VVPDEQQPPRGPGEPVVEGLEALDRDFVRSETG